MQSSTATSALPPGKWKPDLHCPCPAVQPIVTEGSVLFQIKTISLNSAAAEPEILNKGAEQILYTIREKHIKIYIRVTHILDRENALHMFCLHFTTSQTYCEFVFSFFHKIISNVFVFLVWPCFLKKIITYSLRPTKSVVLGNFRHITYLNKWLCYP